MSDARADSEASSVIQLVRECLLDEAGQADEGERESRAAVERRLEFVEAVVGGKQPRLESWFKRALQP
jgi:hypothetical protein